MHSSSVLSLFIRDADRHIDKTDRHPIETQFYKLTLFAAQFDGYGISGCDLDACFEARSGGRSSWHKK